MCFVILFARKDELGKTAPTCIKFFRDCLMKVLILFIGGLREGNNLKDN
jgi:hypothetical protein